MIFAKRVPKPRVMWRTSWAIIPRRLRDGRLAWLHSVGFKARHDDNSHPWVYDTWDNIALEEMKKGWMDA